jgi:hypothetical protein
MILLRIQTSRGNSPMNGAFDQKTGVLESDPSVLGVGSLEKGLGLEIDPKEGAAAPLAGSAFERNKWQKGMASPNPAGRPRRENGGKIDRRTLYKQLFANGAESVIKKAIELAQSGDQKMIQTVLKYTLPESKQELAMVDLGLDINAPLEDRLAALTHAVTAGEISPDAAALVAKSLRDATESAKLLEAMSKLDHLKKEIGRLNGTSR